MALPQVAPVETPEIEEVPLDDRPWVTIVWDDPVNLMSYVTWVFQKLFGYSREKAEKLIRSDCTAAVFGGWTSSSRKAMLPVFEGNDALLFYPVQYEGLESSKNIFYTGATTNQQIVPALDYLKEKGAKSLFLVGSDYVFPQTANKIIRAYNEIDLRVEQDHQGLPELPRRPLGGCSLQAAGPAGAPRPAPARA